MKVFVTGATGFVGSHLIKALLKRKESVTCLVRTQKQARKLKNKGCQAVIADLSDPGLEEKLKPILKNTQVVFHLAAVFAEWGPSKKEYQEINIKAVKKLLQASWEANVKHVIVTSTTHVLGNPPRKLPASEKSSPAPASEYARSKLAAEKLALAYFNKGLPTTIIRPSFVYGPEDKKGAISRFFNQVKEGKMIIVGKGKNRFQLVYVKDLVNAYLAAAKKQGRGKIYVIAGKEAVSLNKLFVMIARALKVEPAQVIKIPQWLALPLSYPLALVFAIGRKFNLPILKNEPLVDPRKTKFITGNFVFDIKKAEKELGFTPQYRLEKGLRETADFIQQTT
jgi:nucleoside-diphosphate-sugar epimerase